MTAILTVLLQENGPAVAAAAVILASLALLFCKLDPCLRRPSPALPTLPSTKTAEIAAIPECITSSSDYSSYCDKFARAFMFLIMELPCLTQQGSRELSAYKRDLLSKASVKECEKVFVFLKKELQEMHDGFSNPHGLLLEDDLSHSGNRHAEVQLRQLGMGLQQSVSMCRNLAEQLETDLYQRYKAVAGLRAANDAVLEQLTLVSGRVEGRINELMSRRRKVVH
jgi:hypothetical protein